MEHYREIPAKADGYRKNPTGEPDHLDYSLLRAQLEQTQKTLHYLISNLSDTERQTFLQEEWETLRSQIADIQSIPKSKDKILEQNLQGLRQALEKAKRIKSTDQLYMLELQNEIDHLTELEKELNDYITTLPPSASPKDSTAPHQLPLATRFELIKKLDPRVKQDY